MSRKIRYVQLEAGAFLSDVEYQAMSAEERGVYCSLLFYLYDSGGRLKAPVTDTEIESFVAVCGRLNPGTDTIGVWRKVKKKFIIRRGYIYHKRVSQEIARSKQYSQAGKKAAKIRWDRFTDRIGTAIRFGCDRNETLMLSKGKESKDNNTIKGMGISKDIEATQPQFSEQLFRDEAIRQGLTETDGINCFEYFASQGFVYGNGIPIPNAMSAIRRWRLYKAKYGGRRQKTVADMVADAKARDDYD